MKNEIVNEFIVCDCGTLDHHFVISISDYEDEKWPLIDISIKMSTYLGFWKRVWVALKFICRCPDNNEYDGVLLNNKSLEKIITILEPYKGKLDH